MPRKKSLKIATYNVRGMVRAGKREMLEIWAKKITSTLFCYKKHTLTKQEWNVGKTTIFFFRKRERRGKGHSRGSRNYD